MLQTTTNSPPAGFHTSNEKKGKEEENLLNLGFPSQFRVSLRLMPRQLHPLLKTLTRISSIMPREYCVNDVCSI